MDQPTKLNMSKKQRLDRDYGADGLDLSSRVANWLVFLILILIFLLLKDVVFKRVEAPRTSLERDVMAYGDRLRKDPQDPVARAGLGIAYMKMGSFSAAASQFDSAVKLRPENPQYLYNLGVAYKATKRYDDALEVLAKAALRSPRWEAPRFETGNIYLEQKKYDKAIAAFEKSLSALEGNANAYYNLARAYELKGDRGQALANYRQALKYVPDYEEADAAVRRLQGK